MLAGFGTLQKLDNRVLCVCVLLCVYFTGASGDKRWQIELKVSLCLFTMPTKNQRQARKPFFFFFSKQAVKNTDKQPGKCRCQVFPKGQWTANGEVKKSKRIFRNLSKAESINRRSYMDVGYIESPLKSKISS